MIKLPDDRVRGPAIAPDRGYATARPVLLLVGNVPVSAGLWSSQVACDLAAPGGNVIVSRCSGEDLLLEAYGQVPCSLPDVGAQDVAAWMSGIGSLGSTWVHCCGLGIGASDWISGREVVTVSGTDTVAQAALCAGLEALGDMHLRACSSPLSVGVCFVGAPEDRAAAAYFAVHGTLAGAAAPVMLRMLVPAPRLGRLPIGTRALYPGMARLADRGRLVGELGGAVPRGFASV